MNDKVPYSNAKKIVELGRKWENGELLPQFIAYVSVTGKRLKHVSIIFGPFIELF